MSPDKKPHSVLRLLALWGLMSSSVVARAALIESLPLDGTTNAIVGTSGVAVNGPTYVADHNGTPDGAIAFTPGGSPSSSYVTVAGGGGLDNLDTGTGAFLGEMERPATTILLRRPIWRSHRPTGERPIFRTTSSGSTTPIPARPICKPA